MIEGCHLQDIPAGAFHGLENLLRLEIRTGNDVPLIIESGAFDTLTRITHLDLSQNKIRNIPSGELCRLTTLHHLNLSTNQFGSVQDTGVDEDCLQLGVLDLSHNQLSVVEERVAANVVDLRLNNNYLRFISDQVLLNSSVSLLSLSNNQLNSLPPNLFHHLSLREVNLANNSLSSLPETLFHGQLSLEILNLEGNMLESSGLSHNLTQDLLNLLELNLCSNHLTDLSADITAPLANLQLLQLCNNQLKQVTLSQNMINLVNLDLSVNLLSTLDSESFRGLTGLTHLGLASNEITEIKNEAFVDMSSLLVLDISNNKLFSLPAAVTSLTSLQTLDVSNNFISDISQEIISSMSGLWRLQMSGNILLNISEHLFTNLHSLQILDLSANRISKVEAGAFSSNTGLRAVRLDGNQLRSFDGVFQNIPNLIWLNISDNHIQHFDYNQLPATLSWLDISHNQLRSVSNQFHVKTSDNISYLDLSFNQLTSIGADHFPGSLETLLLNDNKISSLAPYTFYHMTRLVKVDLSVNEITSFSENAIRLQATHHDDEDNYPSFNLGGNPIACDCKMQWFKSVNQKNKLKHFPHIVDIESIYCQLMDTQVKTFIPLVDARSDQFLCSYSTHCFSLCQCCQFDSCDCEMICPEGCNCFHDNSWSKNIIQCSSNDFTQLPESLPMDATEIFLDGNDLQVLKSHTFIGRKNLRILHLNNSRIEKIENQTFNGLKSLTALHLENNNIATLQGFEFSGLSHLRELYLQNNRITSIANTTFKALKSLEVLFLQGNVIVDFPVWQLVSNPYLVAVRLAANLWSCDCDYAHQFRGYLKVFRSKVQDLEEVTCVSNDAERDNEKLSEFDVTSCHRESAAIAKNQVADAPISDYTPLMIATLASFAIIIIAILLIFAFRNSIRVWVHSKYGVRVFESLESKSSDAGNKLFDAYISYSVQDDMFVRQVISAELEMTSSYRLCLHHRDLPASNNVADTVIRAAEAAERTLIILSNNFVKNEWSRYDYKSGLLQAVNNGSKKLIFVILGNIELGMMDPNLRLLLKNNIVLQWGDGLFWEKLKYSLPDQQQAVPQTPGSVYSTYSRPSTLQHHQFNKNLHGQVNAALHI